MSKLQSLEMEVRELRSDNDRLNREIYDLVMNGQSVALADRDRVIARLLDGWTPIGVIGDAPYWSANGFGPSGGTAAMSDGEAAIIRQHQERNEQIPVGMCGCGTTETFPSKTRIGVPVNRDRRG
jgi:hypothetical protein